MKLDDIENNNREQLTEAQLKEAFFARDMIKNAFSPERAKELRQQVVKTEHNFNQLDRFTRVMETGDFGILIGKTNQTLTEQDIIDIRNEIKEFLRNNDLINYNRIQSGKAGREKMMMIAKSFVSGLESSASLVVGGFLAVMGIASLISGGIVGITMGAIMAGISIPFLKGGKKNRDAGIGFEYMARYVNIIDKYSKRENVRRSDRNFIQSFADKLLMRKPHEVESIINKKVREAEEKAQERLEKAIRMLPQFIPYIDSQGQEQELPVEEFFDV